MHSGSIVLKPSQFPPLLREITDPPEKLYARGTLPKAENKFLAVVGSRKYTPYGKQAVQKLIAGLAGYPIVIVSGLALGIDAIAHEAALEAGLTTVAVPGSGLGGSVLYPASNRALAKRILKAGGCLLSPFPDDFKATPYSFPLRNRIMAGLSHAVLVVEASEKSGTLITSKLATDYNRDVLTVPGSIFSGNSFGPHMLLRLGATPVIKSEEILDALGLKSEARQASVENLSELEQKILASLENPLSRDELIDTLSLPTSEIQVTLARLELRGLIKEEMGEIRRA